MPWPPHGPLGNSRNLVRRGNPCNATCAAEGDNTIMELKIVQDIVRGRTPKLPFALFARLLAYGGRQGRLAVRMYRLVIPLFTLIPGNSSFVVAKLFLNDV